MKAVEEREREREEKDEKKRGRYFIARLTRLLACLLPASLLLLLLNSGSREKKSSSALIVHMDRLKFSTNQLCPRSIYPISLSRQPYPSVFPHRQARVEQNACRNRVPLLCARLKSFTCMLQIIEHDGSILYAKYKGKYSSLADRLAAENNT